MPSDDMLCPLYEFATDLLQGICRQPFSLGHLTSSNGEIFLRAKLDPADLDELAYADAYPAVRAVLSRWGAIHLDTTGQPFRVRFNFYDPRNEDVQFTPAMAPAPVALAAPVAAAPTKRLPIQKTPSRRPTVGRRARNG